MGVIVVGIDDSAGAEAALAFALEEARHRKATLRVVHGWLIPLPVAIPGPVLGGVPVEFGPAFEEQVDAARGVAEKFVERMVERLPTEGVNVERVVVEGQPTRVLLEAAGDADLLIVGSRGRGGFKGLVLGSVSQQCAGHAPCPVVIVPAPPDEDS